MKEELPAAFVSHHVSTPAVLGSMAQIAISQTPWIGGARKASLAKFEETKACPYPIGRPTNPRAEG